MWQSLVRIGPETPEIRWRKKMIETSAVKYNGHRPASWRAAIVIRNCDLSEGNRARRVGIASNGNGRSDETMCKEITSSRSEQNKRDENWPFRIKQSGRRTDCSSLQSGSDCISL